MVPKVSKISTNKNVNITENISKVKILSQWSLKATGFKLGGKDKIPCDGNWVTPKISPKIVPPIIPYKSAPLTFFADKIPIINSEKNVTNPSLLTKFPKARNVDSLATTIPEFVAPIIAIKSPIPTDTAFLSCKGIALNKASRTLKIDKKIKIIPSKNTAVSA